MVTMRQRILVVDDDPSLAEMLTIVLRGEGFDTAVVGDGSQALTAVRELRPDLVLVAPSSRVAPRLRALGLSLGELQPALQSAEAQLPAGALVDRDQRTVLEATGFILQAADLNRLVVAVKIWHDLPAATRKYMAEVEGK